jgi:hypothetical protein
VLEKFKFPHHCHADTPTYKCANSLPIFRKKTNHLGKSGSVKRTAPPASPGSAPTPSTAKKVARGNKDQELVATNWAVEMNRDFSLSGESLEEDVRSTSGAPTIGSKDSTKEGLSQQNGGV